MRAREIVFAIACALAGAALAYFARLALGNWPSPVMYYSLLIIGLGAALVTVRYGRLGPFEGELGTPRLETELRDRVRRETERSVRYGREFSVLAVKQEGNGERWRANVRGVDDIVACRRGLLVLLLPETSREGALTLLRRVSSETHTPARAALVSCPADGRTGDALSTTLLRLVRESEQPGVVLMRSDGAIQAVPIGA